MDISWKHLSDKVGKALRAIPANWSETTDLVVFAVAILIGTINHQHKLQGDIDYTLLVDDSLRICEVLRKNFRSKFLASSLRICPQFKSYPSNIVMRI